jgi:ADP-ribosyl-[dinitrogen reductase] hydrolase
LQPIDHLNKTQSVLFGVAIGDALGVPVEFKSRDAIRQHPVTDLIGYGTYNLPPGTFSDDSSLTFCLAEALVGDFNLHTTGELFVRWYHEGYWAARGDVFDIGNTTREAIKRLAKGTRPDLAGEFDATSNGNGSLMRILPLLFYVLDKPVEERYEIIKQVSSITHGHIRSVISCFYYLEFALEIFAGKKKFEIYKDVQSNVKQHLSKLSITKSEVEVFNRLLVGNIYEFPEEEISSSGYVLHTLEASIWCLLTTDSYAAAVLKAVNLGFDTDTTGAVTGGLAGLLYGMNGIPDKWKSQIARHDDIMNLAWRLADKYIKLPNPGSGK